MRNIFVFDKNKCVGCGACAVACLNENGSESAMPWREISNSNAEHFPGIPLFNLSLACNHCEDAPCMQNCPALAYSRDSITGAIIHHAEKCIGCKYCTWACPYDAPKYNPNKGIVEKCTFCNHRLSESDLPACTEGCPIGALSFGRENYNRKEAQKSSPVKVDVGAGFKSIELRNKRGPEIDESLFEDVPRTSETKQESKIKPLHEWPLMLFTLLSSLMVVLVANGEREFAKNPYILPLIGIVAAILSTAHLGQKFRAYRAVFNLKGSWLSREIASFGLFMGLILANSFLLPISQTLLMVSGIVLLISIDKLYFIARWQWPIPYHSGQTLFIAASGILLLQGHGVLFWALLIARSLLLLYVPYLKGKLPSILVILRLLLLVTSGVGMFLSHSFLWVLLAFCLGEILDRILFYKDLEVPIVREEIREG